LRAPEMRVSYQISTIIGQAGRFGASGLVNTALGVFVIFLLTALGLNYVLANAGGYLVGLMTSFLLNKHWTFRAKGDQKGELIRFLAVFAVGYLVNIAAVAFAVEILGWRALVAQLVGVACYVALSFLGMKFLVFVDKKL